MTTAEKIKRLEHLKEIYKAQSEGKIIQRLCSGVWMDLELEPVLNWFTDYRIKPEEPNSIPATEEELKKIEGCAIWVKRKDDHSKIGWRRITGPVDIKTFYIFNPNTKCWEDREENADKEERLRHHYNGGQP